MDDGQNYTTFSSRGLLDMIGDLNDKALEASRMKDFIGVLSPCGRMPFDAAGSPCEIHRLTHQLGFAEI